MLARSLLAICLMLFSHSVLFAGVKTKAAKEAAEYVVSKFGKEAAKEGAESLTRRIEAMAVTYGDDAFAAVKKVGPRAFQVAEEAGEHGRQAIKLMASHGDSAIWIVAKKNRMAIFLKHGDDAAKAMIKHGEVAEPVIHRCGKPAVSALNAISTQNGRRLAMIADDGTLSTIGRTDELLGVVGRYGDSAMDFIWRNKGSLAVTTALAAFLNNPKPFLDGTIDLTKTVAQNTLPQLAVGPGQVVGVGFILFVILIVFGIFGRPRWLKRRSKRVFKAG